MSNSTLRLQFLDLDLDKSGFITADELLAQMPEGSLDKAKSILEMMDENNDGKISYDEFLRFYEGVIEEDEDEALEYVDSDVNYVEASDATRSTSIDESALDND